MIDEHWVAGLGERIKADNQVRESDKIYRKDTSYHDEFLSADQLGIHFLELGIITLKEMINLASKYPNDQEFGTILRKILNKQI